MDIQCPLVSAVGPISKLLDPLTTSIHFSLHVVKLTIAFGIDHKVVPLKAGVIDRIVPAVYAAGMTGLGVVDPHKQCVVGVCGLIALPVGSLYQMVGLIVDKCSGLLLAGFSNPVASLIILVSIGLILAVRAFYKLVQLIVLIINRFIFDFFIYQVAKGIIGISGLCLGDIAGRHPVQVVVGVDMCSLLCLVSTGITLVLGSWIVRFFRFIRIVVLIRFFLVSTVQSRRCIATIVIMVS